MKHPFRCRASRTLRLAVFLGFGLTAPVAAQTKLLRFPDIHGDHVVFTYAGDLWTSPAGGGTAARLTAHPGLELFGKYSPDGAWIAFTGQYDGDEQVYVIPATGGVPKQLTFFPAQGPLPPRWGYDNQVYGWTPDGTSVVFRSLRDGWDLGDNRLYSVPVTGGLPVALPHAAVRRRRPVARRHQGRVLAPLPGLPRVEALPGRLGRGPVGLRPRHARREEHHRQHAHRPRPDVDRGPHLLRLRPRRQAQPLLGEARRHRPGPAHPRDDVGRALAQRRRDRQHRLPVGR